MSAIPPLSSYRQMIGSISPLTLKDHGVSAVPEQFWTEIESAIRRFKSRAKLHKETSPSQVRKNLTNALDQAKRFVEALENLDGNSKQLITKRRKNVFTETYAAVLSLTAELSNARELAEKYPKKGRLPESHREYLAADIAAMMRQQLKVDPSGTRERGSKSSLFSTLIAQVLSIATGKDVSSVHDLVAKVLKNEIRTVDAQGLVIYTPAGRAD